MERSILVYWFALLLAATANTISNVSLKHAMSSIKKNSEIGVVQQVASMPSFWFGLLFAGILLFSYLFAIRYLSVGTAYAFTTSLAMAGIIIVEHFAFGTPIGTTKMVGIVFVATGIWMLSASA